MESFERWIAILTGRLLAWYRREPVNLDLLDRRAHGGGRAPDPDHQANAWRRR
jgi:hypothetical protein